MLTYRPVLVEVTGAQQVIDTAMTDTELELLERELREAKEERVRRDRERDMKGITTTCPTEFRRLTQLGPNELDDHIERLERDIADYKRGSDWVTDADMDSESEPDAGTDE